MSRVTWFRVLVLCVVSIICRTSFAADVTWSHQFKFDVETSSFNSCASNALQANPGIVLSAPNSLTAAVGFTYLIEGTMLRGVATLLPGGFASVVLYGIGASEPRRIKMMLPRVLFDIAAEIKERCKS